MANLYALLVGINDYSKTPAASLRGCLDDIAFYQRFLEDRYANSLKLEVRKDSEATHDNIVGAFRSHLSKAGKDDVALFVYAGHGARWKSAPEFAKFFPDGYDEGLVCYDSRSESGKYDLADKELAMLLQELAANEPHIAVILDSCHSGSATRSVDTLEGARTRATLAVDDARPFESYLDGQYVKRNTASESLILPQSKHILLAACRRTQEALELGGRGSFSQKMEKVLGASGGDISYAELYSRCRAAMRVPRNQDPQFETYGHFNAHTKFLGSSVAAQTRHLVFFDRGEDMWVAECGAFQNLPTEANVKVELSIQDDDGNELGVVQTKQVGMQKSELRVNPSLRLEKSVQYKAELLSLPVPPMPVFVKGDEEGLKALRSVLQPSDSVELVESDEGIDYGVEAKDGVLQLLDVNKRMLQGARGYTDAAALMVADWIRHIVRFTRTLALQNFSSAIDFSSIDTRFVYSDKSGREDAYSITLVGGRDTVVLLGDQRKTRPDGTIVLEYAGDGKEDDDLTVRFEVANRTGQDLHVAVLAFTNEYKIRKNAKELIPPGGSVVELDRTSLFLDSNVDEEIVTYKFIVSTEEIDDQFLVMQNGFAIGEILDPQIRRGERRHDASPAKYDDEWYTTTFSVKLVRQVADAAITP